MHQVKSNAKLKNLPEDAHEDMWLLRNPEDPQGKVFSYDEILVELPRMFGGLTSSRGALSEYYRWLELKRRNDAKEEASIQLMEDLARDDSISEEAIKKIGRKLFMVEGVTNKDARTFAEMVRIGNEDVKLQQNAATLKLNKKRTSLEERRVVMLEKKAQQLDALAQIRTDDTMTPEQQREAVLAKMDEYFGVKKKEEKKD